LNPLLETLDFDKPHREKVLAIVLPNFIDGYDSWMVKIGRSFRFHLNRETSSSDANCPRQNHLHGHQTIQIDLTSLVNNPYAAAGQLRKEFVIAKVTHPFTDARRPLASRVGTCLRLLVAGTGGRHQRHCLLFTRVRIVRQGYRVRKPTKCPRRSPSAHSFRTSS
jgi:hypothetical protein